MGDALGSGAGAARWHQKRIANSVYEICRHHGPSLARARRALIAPVNVDNQNEDKRINRWRRCSSNVEKIKTLNVDRRRRHAAVLTSSPWRSRYSWRVILDAGISENSVSSISAYSARHFGVACAALKSSNADSFRERR